MDKAQIKNKIAALELLNELPIKYPTGSTVCIGTVNFSDPIIYQVAWCDRVGKGWPLQNIERSPKEWQNLSKDEAEAVAARFQKVVMLPHFTTKAATDSYRGVTAIVKPFGLGSIRVRTVIRQ